MMFGAGPFGRYAFGQSGLTYNKASSAVAGTVTIVGLSLIHI